MEPLINQHAPGFEIQAYQNGGKILKASIEQVGKL